ncbi:MAG: condensation domain-containing protein, partial [Actinomycetota bacterium]|nr:condensation domain-containing protein [Actinomycetota bacterium]
ARHPLFQTMLVLQNTPAPTLTLPGIEVEIRSADLPVARFDLALVLAEHHPCAGRPGGLRGSWEYAAELFDLSTIEAMSDQFLDLLTAVAADPDLPVDAIGPRPPT